MGIGLENMMENEIQVQRKYAKRRKTSEEKAYTIIQRGQHSQYATVGLKFEAQV